METLFVLPLLPFGSHLRSAVYLIRDGRIILIGKCRSIVYIIGSLIPIWFNPLSLSTFLLQIPSISYCLLPLWLLPPFSSFLTMLVLFHFMKPSISLNKRRTRKIFYGYVNFEGWLFVLVKTASVFLLRRSNFNVFFSFETHQILWTRTPGISVLRKTSSCYYLFTVSPTHISSSPGDYFLRPTF